MKLEITLELDNAAFQDGEPFEGPGEVSRILRTLAANLENGWQRGDTGNLVDVNGNQAGTWEVTETGEV